MAAEAATTKKKGSGAFTQVLVLFAVTFVAVLAANWAFTGIKDAVEKAKAKKAAAETAKDVTA